MFNPEKITQEKESRKSIEKLIEELEDEMKRLKEMPHQSSDVGITEFMDIGKHHPILLDFFSEAPDVLPNCDKEKLKKLEIKFLRGEIDEKEELERLKTDFFIPFWQKKGYI